jgi:hypothetical protein
MCVRHWIKEKNRLRRCSMRYLINTMHSIMCRGKEIDFKEQDSRIIDEVLSRLFFKPLLLFKISYN